MNILDLLRMAPVIPVLTIEDPRTAPPIARALVEGGLPVIEVALRTPLAMEALRLILAEVKEAMPGVGTVTQPAQLAEAKRAGALFAVSPGSTARLAAAAKERGIPYLPGVATVSEAMAMAEQGFTQLKFFPAAAAGGPAFLRAVAQPLPGIQFCPTGGIDSSTAPSYLALPNVLCVGGSWVVPDPAVRARDWGRIRSLASAAVAMRAGMPLID
jgi:2-dehydro-3-deoxyphosphogluconate aldolase/(4S)-4-hydroxy-2-oxoglutarate aldolase